MTREPMLLRLRYRQWFHLSEQDCGAAMLARELVGETQKKVLSGPL